MQHEWKCAAIDGKPTSCHVPVVTNPYVDPELVTPFRHPYVDIDDGMTPEKPVAPYRKAQVVAQKRLEQQLKQSRKNQQKSDNQDRLDKVSQPVTKKSKPIGKKKDAKQKPKGKKAEKETARTRKAPDGPMHDAMGKFLVKYKKEHGPSHIKALAAWKVSDERHAIISSLDPSERKRRRFDK